MADARPATCCPACGGSDTPLFFRMESVPVFCNVLWPTRKAALAAPKAQVSLAFCRACGLIFNAAFDPALTTYSSAYENSLHFSPRFNRYADDLTRRLAQRHGLRGKNVIEIGCGQGDFLALLTDLGACHAIGFDPSFETGRSSACAGRPITIIPEPYSEAHACLPADFVCCRHVLEHVADPLSFLKTVRRAVGERPGTVIFFEVPNALYTLRQLGVWDVIYEHCSYFTAESLLRLFCRAGFEPFEVAEQYGGQFLTIEARPQTGTRPAAPIAPAPDFPDVAGLVGEFDAAFAAKVAFWRSTLGSLRRRDVRPVVWGAGSKGVTFLNVLGLDYPQVEYVVDISPRKTGRFVPGTAQQIVPPDFLREYRPDPIIVMNPIYQAEIGEILAGMSLDTEVLAA